MAYLLVHLHSFGVYSQDPGHGKQTKIFHCRLKLEKKGQAPDNQYCKKNVQTNNKKIY